MTIQSHVFLANTRHFFIRNLVDGMLFDMQDAFINNPSCVDLSVVRLCESDKVEVAVGQFQDRAGEKGWLMLTDRVILEAQFQYITTEGSGQSGTRIREMLLVVGRKPQLGTSLENLF